MRLKELLTGGIVLVAFGACTYMDVRADYDWAPSYITRARATGWQLLATRSNATDLVRPWTWFWTPVTSLWFVRTDRLVAYDSARVGLPVLAAHWDFDHTEEFRSFVAVDVGKNRLVDVFGDSTLANLGEVADSSWESPSTMIDSMIVAYITSRSIR